MTQFMRAHGRTPGPTQRPVLTGAVCGLLAQAPAAPLSWFCGGIPSISRSVGAPPWAVLLAQVLIMAAAGALYGRVFLRAANDRRGGWLLGISYAFLIWLVGPVAILQ